MKDARARWRGERWRRHPGDAVLLLRDLVHSQLRRDSGLLETCISVLIAQRKKDIFQTFLEAFSWKYNVESSKTENHRYVEDKLWHENKQMQVLDNPGSYWDLSFQYQRKSIRCNKTRAMISNTSNSNTIRHNQSVIQYSQSQRPAPWLKRQLCSPRSERPLLFCAWRQAEDAAPSVGQTSAERPFVSGRSCSSLLRTQIQKKYWKNKTSIDELLSARLK